MANDAFSETIKKKVKGKYELYTGDCCGYNHTTYKISTLSDYIDMIHIISDANGRNEFDKTTVFRGVADKTYGLLPGLARIKSSNSNLERELISEYLTRCPDAFYGLSEFDMIAKMQHYGLPTRLLDFTLNPLVALYFACESRSTKDGRVICHGTYLQNYSSKLINRICEMIVNKDYDENYSINDFYCNEELSFRQYMIDVYISSETTVVRPKYWNRRIMNQEGVFMVFFNVAYDKYLPVLVNAGRMGVEKAILEYGRGFIDEGKINTALEIEPIDQYVSVAKRELTRECLSGMHEAYKDKEYNMNRYWDMLKDRIYFGGDINHVMAIRENEGLNSLLGELDETTIANDFCSIIIESKHKKKLLQELSVVGIRADYIYPELEYSAQEIRRRYE